MPAIPSLIFHFISLVERNPYITARPADYEYRSKLNSPMYKKTQEPTRQQIFNIKPQNLRAFLLRGLNQAAIAEMCGVGVSTISVRIKECGIKYKKK